MELETKDNRNNRLEHPFLAYYFDTLIVISSLGILEFITKLITSSFDIFTLNSQPAYDLISTLARFAWLVALGLIFVYHFDWKYKVSFRSVGETLAGVRSSNGQKFWFRYTRITRSFFFTFHLLVLALICITVITVNYRLDPSSLSIILIPATAFLLFCIVWGQGQNKTLVGLCATFSLLMLLDFISILIFLTVIISFVLGIVLAFRLPSRESLSSLSLHEIPVVRFNKAKFLFGSLWPFLILIVVMVVKYLR